MRRLNLLLHVTASAGWWGAVLAFLVLAVAGTAAPHEAACRALVLTGWGAIVPLAALSSLTGLYMSLAGAWGLFKHWWVLFKVVITLPCSALLLLHLGGLGTCTHGTATQMTIDAGLALVVLMAPMVLSIYKPRGTTPWFHASSRKDGAVRAAK